jgi:hypothetical protein
MAPQHGPVLQNNIVHIIFKGYLTIPSITTLNSSWKLRAAHLHFNIEEFVWVFALLGDMIWEVRLFLDNRTVHGRKHH